MDLQINVMLIASIVERKVFSHDIQFVALCALKKGNKFECYRTLAAPGKLRSRLLTVVWRLKAIIVVRMVLK